MMTYEKWTAVAAHLFILCGIRKMDEKQHGYYLAAMYAELKKRFTDDEIGVAARQIAETENLYGAYPPLSVWLKYAPMERVQAHIENAKTAEIRGILLEIANGDPMWFDAEQTEKDFIDKYGEQGQFVLNEFGGVRGLRNALYKATQYTQESIIKDFVDAWTRSAIDIKVKVPQLVAQPELKRIK